MTDVRAVAFGDEAKRATVITAFGTCTQISGAADTLMAGFDLQLPGTRGGP